MSDDGPRLIRPIPRRPFDVNLTTPTPPDDSPSEASAPLDFSSLRYLQATPEPTVLSRPPSYMNLTSSALYGIYSQSASAARDNNISDREDLDTPWGMGAQTPIKRPSIDDATYELLRDRSHLVRRRSSLRPVEASGPFKPGQSTSSSVLRGLLLFTLGVGYGVLVTTRFHYGQGQLATLADGIIPPAHNWAHVGFWGLAGVGLGGLLPWFDRVWENSFGQDQDGDVVQKDSTDKGDEIGTDWALVVRAIGAFVGIVFAIRKVAWASTLQVSLTLALVNPFLWWLIDRSKPGFLLSAAVGLTGSLFLLGIDPDMMPAPTRAPIGNVSSSAVVPDDDQLLVLGGLAQQKTVESLVWMLSVLFCSCICFGNIGRRLAFGRSGGIKGRWAGAK